MVCVPSTSTNTDGSALRNSPARVRSFAISSATARMLSRCSSRYPCETCSDSVTASRIGSLNQAWMPKWKKATAKHATRIAGATATPPNSSTSRTCSRAPAEPRRRSTQTRVSRPASTATSSNTADRLASTSPTPTPGRSTNGAPRARKKKVARPTVNASAASTSVTVLPSRMLAIRPSTDRARDTSVAGGGSGGGSGLNDPGGGATFTSVLAPRESRGHGSFCAAYCD